MRWPPATAAASHCAVSGFDVIDEIKLEAECSSAPDYLTSDGRIRWIFRHYDDDDDDGMKIERKREEGKSFGSLTRFHPPQEEEKKEKEMMKREKKR